MVIVVVVVVVVVVVIVVAVLAVVVDGWRGSSCMYSHGLSTWLLLDRQGIYLGG